MYDLKGKIIYAPSSTVRDPCWQLTNICCYSCRPLILKLASMALWVCYGTSHQNSLYSRYVVNFLIEYWRYIINLTLCKFLYRYSVCKYCLTNKPYTIGGGGCVGGKPPGEFLGTPSKSVIYHPRNMSGKFGAIGRHVTISRLRALTIDTKMKLI